MVHIVVIGNCMVLMIDPASDALLTTGPVILNCKNVCSTDIKSRTILTGMIAKTI